MKVYKQDGKIIFEFPEELPRSNPWTEGDVGSFPYFTGIIVPQKNCSDPEMGFAGTIDMDYKGKPDQWSDIIVHWHGEKEDFIKKCEELGVEHFEYIRCAKCKGPIYGTATFSKGGPVCTFTCEEKNGSPPSE